MASQVSSSALDEPGIALSLEPLTVAEDPDYLPRLLSQRNVPPDFAELLS